MFIHPIILEHRIKEQQNDLLKYMTNERRIRGIKSAGPGMTDRLFIRFAEFLISWGMKIKERHQAIISSCAEACMHKQNSL